MTEAPDVAIIRSGHHGVVAISAIASACDPDGDPGEVNRRSASGFEKEMEQMEEVRE
jgi:hypothetical protein